MPIRDVDLQYSPAVNSVELGTSYVQAATQLIRSARFYVNTPQPTTQAFQVGLVGIYPTGTEAETGPIRQVIIPCMSGSTTGSNISFGGGSTSVADAVYIPGDGKYMDYSYNSGSVQDTSFWFNTGAYPVLNGKRILNVSLLYAGSIYDVDPVSQANIPFIDPEPGSIPTTVVRQRDDFNTGQTFSGPAFFNNAGALADLSTVPNSATNSPLQNQTIGVLNLGDINNYLSTTFTVNKLPWRYPELLRFMSTHGSGRQQIWLRVQLPTTAGSALLTGYPQLRLDYMALRVVFCEETRIAYGARWFSYLNGFNDIPLADLNQAADPVIAAGTYTPTLSWVSAGEIDYGQTANGDFPLLNATRELYQIPSHPGVQVNVPFPVEERLGSEFSSVVSHVLPQLSLHASGGTLTEPHVYGRQAAAQVYGVNTATQDIYDDISGVAADYPQVRYYARRFGDTTVPLTLTGATGAGLLLPGTAGNYATTPDDAALDIVGDIELQVDVTMEPSVWNTGTPTFLAKWNGAARSYRLDLNGSGAITLFWSTTGADTVSLTSTVAVPTNSTRLALKATLDVNNGGGGSTATFYTAPTISGPWTQLGAAVIGAVTSIFSSTAQGEVGGRNAGTSGLFAGTVHAAKILNGIAGTEVANPDFGAQAPGTLVFVDAAGRTWTVNGTAAIVGGNTGSSVAITVAEFDELQKITDGWAEVTLRFTTAPSMGAVSGNPAWTWSAAGETAGNRWEILAACAPAISGMPTSNLTPVPSPNNLGPATYQPPAGSTVELTWMPQGIGSPWVTGHSQDSTTDAVLIFSQDPPTVTGVGLTAATQTVTGIGLDCGSLPCCIPSGIAYQQITWSATSLPATGFGAYELQRFDYLDQTGDFQTIMFATSPTVTGFNDYEARVGITSVYRIRSLNVLNFAGAWSTYVSGAPPEPGVYGGCSDATGALIFTSNADQSGASNAAYVMQWDGTPDEAFSLPEADAVIYQPVYQRDGSIAFHGTERGLETFSRALLLQSAAIDPIRLADAKTLRDLAWADLPYVCVRDDIGDRWFSSVRVPTVNVRANRTKYMARVEIVETTVTPYPVDP